MEYFLGVYFFVIGAIVGSFLNVCIIRMPLEESIVKPRSHCRHCKKIIPWYDNIPFVSFLLLRGRCRFCQNKISPRYFLVELITASLFLVFYLHLGLSWILFPYLVFVSALIVATFVDIDHRIIPDEISVGGMVVGFVFSLIFPAMHGVSKPLLSLGFSLLGALVGGSIIYAIGVLGDFLFKKESMGGGDVKLLAMIGAFLGWKMAVLTFFIAPFFGAVVGIIIKIRTKDSMIPYGPFLSLASLISLYGGDKIVHWVLRGYGYY